MNVCSVAKLENCKKTKSYYCNVIVYHCGRSGGRIKLAENFKRVVHVPPPQQQMCSLAIKLAVVRFFVFVLFLDGHHKLIRWRLITHGGIDGYSRMIVYLHCSSNSQANTVYSLFLKAVRRFGLPSRVRSDFGGENVMVACHMLRYRGTDRGSIITGSSTHNQRVERMWVDVHRSVTRLFYSLFYFLEQHGLLDPLNELHIFALHYIFIPRINRALEAFQNGWNHHGMRTVSNLSPYQQFVRGKLELHSSGLTALDFFRNVDADYGVSIEDPVPSADEPAVVVVPPVRFSLSGEELNQIVAMYDPLQDSDNYGIDLYLSVVGLLQAHSDID